MNFLVHEEWVGDTSILSENTEVRHFTFTQLLMAQCPKAGQSLYSVTAMRLKTMAENDLTPAVLNRFVTD